MELSTKAEAREFEKTHTSKVETLTQKIRDEKAEIQSLYESEKRTSLELRLQLEQATKSLNALREENTNLRHINKTYEETIANFESVEKENMIRFKYSFENVIFILRIPAT